MSQYPHAHFILSANSARQFPPDEGLEVAFAGRSNAGKSSAINALVNRRQFARTSKTPGRTQLVNFFALSGDTRIVDLPGYGYARVTDAMRQHWAELIGAYFERRDSLKGLFLIVDIRRGLTDFDRQLLALADSRELAVHVLLTKADKLKRGQASNALLAARRELGQRATAQLFSATRREGLDEARSALDAMLGREAAAPDVK